MKLYFAADMQTLTKVGQEGFTALAGPEVEIMLSDQPPAQGSRMQVELPEAESYELREPLDLPDGRWFAVPAAVLDATSK